MKTIKLPFRLSKPILACGSDLKGAFALAKGREAVLIEGFGDLAELENFEKYEKALKKNERKFHIKPAIIACDLHPEYVSTRFGEDTQRRAYSVKLCKVQHHEAHIASAIVDNNVKGEAVGVAFDGTGFGSDGNMWGGEFFLGHLKAFKRVAHFEYIQMPGADMAVIEPWRMAASYLYKIYGDDFLKLKVGFVKKLDRNKWAILKKMIDGGINSPLTSSAGRLFDAVASMILLKDKAAFEAELPIELEKTALEACRDSYGFDLKPDKDTSAINTSKIIRGVINDLSKDVDRSMIASRFHNTIADIVLKVSLSLRERFGVNKVILSGGVFQNRYLSARTIEVLVSEDFKVYAHSNIQTNDSSIPIGQIAIANARTSCA